MSAHSQRGARPRRHLRYAFRRHRTGALSVEPRRALAVYRALDLSGDRTSSRALLGFSGRRLAGRSVVISPADCAALARSLRDSGYPLSDGGIRLFKMERGFSTAVRIGPDVAAAYGRFALGKDARLNVSAEEWKRLDTETRRVLRLLMLIGRDPDTLVAVRRVLGVRDSRRAPDGTVLVGRVTAQRLLSWAHGYGWSFDDSGLRRLARALGAQRLPLDRRVAGFVADSILCRGEPAHDYRRFVCAGATLNRRTLSMLRNAERRLEGAARLVVTRGSYAGSSRGAHPHLGGGAVDLVIEPTTPERVERVVGTLREVGFAAWFRTRLARQHVHAVAIGDLEASAAAVWQVKSYFEGKDGRSRSAPDPHGAVPAALPRWTAKYRVAFL